MRIFIRLVMAACVVLCISATLSSTDTVIHGVVTEAAGKPVRGAIVNATAGEVSVSRHSQSDGPYEISFPAGNYGLSVEAYGLSPKRQVRQLKQLQEKNARLK